MNEPEEVGDALVLPLTDEEWADLSRGGRDWVARGDLLITSLKGVTLHLHGEETTLDARAAHTLAAVALAGQPFGFTWADVDALSEVFSGFVSAWHNCGGDTTEIEATARGAIERIAALLPPRET